MKVGDLLNYLTTNTPYPALDGDASESINKAKDGSHSNPYAAEVINTLAAAGFPEADSEMARADFVKALAPLRLKYMADDAPVDGFRTVEKYIMTADAGFNEEALSQKGK